MALTVMQCSSNSDSTVMQCLCNSDTTVMQCLSNSDNLALILISLVCHMLTSLHVLPGPVCRSDTGHLAVVAAVVSFEVTF